MGSGRRIVRRQGEFLVCGDEAAQSIHRNRIERECWRRGDLGAGRDVVAGQQVVGIVSVIKIDSFVIDVPDEKVAQLGAIAVVVVVEPRDKGVTQIFLGFVNITEPIERIIIVLQIVDDRAGGVLDGNLRLLPVRPVFVGDGVIVLISDFDNTVERIVGIIDFVIAADPTSESISDTLFTCQRAAV